MSSDNYADSVVRRFVRDITDYVFWAIQHDENLMREYQSNVDRYHLKPVNTAIGKKVKELLNLDDDGISDDPKSWLIKSYTCHKPKV